MILPETNRIQKWTIESLKNQKFEIPFLKRLKVYLIILEEILNKKHISKIFRIIKENLTLKELRNKKGNFLIIKMAKLILYILGCIHWQVQVIFRIERQCKVKNYFFIFYDHILPQNIKKIYFIGKDKYTFLLIFLSRKFNVKLEKLDLKKISMIIQKEKESLKVLISCFKNKKKYYKMLRHERIEDKDIILL